MWHFGFNRPEHVMMIAIIESAYIERDWDYFSRDAFMDHCAILNVNPDIMREMILSKARGEGIL